jgi:hypothetical protein
MVKGLLTGWKVRVCSVGVGDAERGRTNANLEVCNELELCMAAGCGTVCCLLYRAEIWLHHGYTSFKDSSRYIGLLRFNAEERTSRPFAFLRDPSPPRC